MQIIEDSKKSKASVNFNSISGSLMTDTFIDQNNSNDEICNEIVGETMLKVVYEPKMK